MMEYVERALAALESIAKSLKLIASDTTQVQSAEPHVAPTVTVDIQRNTTQVQSAETSTVIPATVVTPAVVSTPVATTEPTPTSIATTPTPASKVDRAGIPWDARIHGAGKTILSDRDNNRPGCWKYKKGVDKVTLVPQVEAELRAQHPVQVTESATVTPSVFDQPLTEPAAQHPGVETVVIQPVIAPETLAPVVHVSKEELDACLLAPPQDPQLAHVNRVMIEVVKRDGAPVGQDILRTWGGVETLTQIDPSMFIKMFAVFFNQYHHRHPQGSQTPVA
jgi:hypothetical protein